MMVYCSLTRHFKVGLLEIFFLSMNPRKDPFLNLRKDQGLLEIVLFATSQCSRWNDEDFLEPNRDTFVIFFLYGYLKVLVSVVTLPIRLVRNALWINITIISVCGILPLSVRTRAATILLAAESRRRLGKKSGFQKGPVYVNIGKEHRKFEENMETTLRYHFQHRTEKVLAVLE